MELGVRGDEVGGWIAPDVAIGQMRGEHRLVAAAEWADRHRDDYKSTASTLHILMIYVPNPRMGLNVSIWMAERHKFAELFTNDDRPGMQERRVVLANDHVTDAWGSEFPVSFDERKNVALIVSPGPDKAKGTEDDLVCIGAFRPGFEDGRAVWEKSISWRLPEGLGATVEEYTDKPYGTIEYTKASGRDWAV